jgi:hypothetical protein
MRKHPQMKLTLSRRKFLAQSATAGSMAAAYLSFPQKTYAANGDTLKVGVVVAGELARLRKRSRRIRTSS